MVGTCFVGVTGTGARDGDIIGDAVGACVVGVTGTGARDGVTKGVNVGT
jgi:hypothetical protein